MAYLNHILYEGKHHLILTPEEIKLMNKIVSKRLKRMLDHELYKDETFLKEDIELDFQSTYLLILNNRFQKA